MIRKYCEMFKNPWAPAIVQIRWVILIIGDLREFGIDWYDCICKLPVIRSELEASSWGEGKIWSMASVLPLTRMVLYKSDIILFAIVQNR